MYVIYLYILNVFFYTHMIVKGSDLQNVHSNKSVMAMLKTSRDKIQGNVKHEVGRSRCDMKCWNGFEDD